MVFAMHQIQVAVHRRAMRGESAFFRGLPERVRASSSCLIASATSEIGVGGDMRTSMLRGRARRRRLHARRSTPPSSPTASTPTTSSSPRGARRTRAGSDQVLVLVKRDEYTLDRVGGWDTLGMRGTCSYGFVLKAKAPVDQVLAVPFADISAQTMLPVSHILWAHVWLGIATVGGLARAQVRACRGAQDAGHRAAQRAARWPSSSVSCTRCAAACATPCSSTASATTTPTRSPALGFAIRMNNLKIATAEQVVPDRLQGHGSLRHQRLPQRLAVFARPAPARRARRGVMILNDRIYGTNATLLLVSKED